MNLILRVLTVFLLDVKYYIRIQNYSEVCDIFECSERSLKRWVERYNKTGDIERKPRK